jgi:hypothetical protein
VIAFIAPTPNCGHGGSTFTWYALGETWLCGACHASIGLLGARCARCQSPAPDGTRLVEVHACGLLCVTCQRDRVRFARPTA